MMMNITPSKCLLNGHCLSCENDMYVQCYAYVLMLMTMQMDKLKALHQPMKFLTLKETIANQTDNEKKEVKQLHPFYQILFSTMSYRNTPW